MILAVLRIKLDALYKKYSFLTTNPPWLCYTKKNVNLSLVIAKAF